MEVVTKIPPTKMFKAFVIDGDSLIPKIVPQAIKNVEVVEGDGGPGRSQFDYVKHKIKTASSPDGGSICRSISKYYTVGDFEIKEEQIKAGKDKASGMFKAIEAYLLANPDAN
ncbi:hypothetical protein Pint_24419 [Pistacia integerrima]|uniref:Uncharacterized protein n=1 Tax=Pistacia integerrima TaxID=434235 RepID=A0ACC0YF58_9ROSI|nr:hypothetical protein Pint_24419 [Pistacia integerrima]